MDTNAYGGVGAKEVIIFQTKIMMGAQFGRVMYARDNDAIKIEDRQNEILIACLRLGWNDAFRHTSQNEGSVQNDINNHNKTYTASRFKLFRGKIKRYDASLDFDDYFSHKVISDKDFLEIFKSYAASSDKCKVVNDNWKLIQNCFKGVKKLDGNKMLSFGHIQKMFNIAIKLYLCLYICRDELGLCDCLFVNSIVNNFNNAHCPIDSIILGELEQKQMEKLGEGADYSNEYNSYTWSQLSSTDYAKIQNDIKNECNGKSNLWFDFDNWS